MDPSNTGDYHVTFLSRHPDDNHLCDDAARWWPEWHEYSMNDENISVYGSRMLFKPNRKPDLKKYMLWSDSVHLTDFPALFLPNNWLHYVIESIFSTPVLH